VQDRYIFSFLRSTGQRTDSFLPVIFGIKNSIHILVRHVRRRGGIAVFMLITDAIAIFTSMLVPASVMRVLRRTMLAYWQPQCHRKPLMRKTLWTA
jgi:hypothetical protein